MSIPNYLYFKKSLVRINNSYKPIQGAFKRKEGIFYSPILRDEAMLIVRQEAKKDIARSWNERDIRGYLNYSRIENCQIKKNIDNIEEKKTGSDTFKTRNFNEEKQFKNNYQKTSFSTKPRTIAKSQLKNS